MSDDFLERDAPLPVTQRAAPCEVEPSFELLPGALDKGLVLICDHASNYLPAKYAMLGLSSREFERHIAYDIGAAQVTRQMSALLGVPAVLSNFSRLLIDPNRAMDDPTLIMQLSDGAVIPGNALISKSEREQRLKGYYQPYHQAIDQVLEECIRAGHPPALVSIHSFTQEWHGTLRPWEGAILWDHDERLVKPLLDCLRKETDFNIGDNEPYSGDLLATPCISMALRAGWPMHWLKSARTRSGMRTARKNGPVVSPIFSAVYWQMQTWPPCLASSENNPQYPPLVDNLAGSLVFNHTPIILGPCINTSSNRSDEP